MTIVGVTGVLHAKKRHVTSYKRIPLCKNCILEGRGYAVMGRGAGGGG